jgi:hypothetical protein
VTDDLAHWKAEARKWKALSRKWEGRAKAAETAQPDELPADLDGIDPSIPSGSKAYWKARSRLWEARCRRAEGEKTDLIRELAAVKAGKPAPEPGPLEHRRARADAILRGDTYA